MTLELRNPHSILAALKHRPHDVREIRVISSSPGGAWDEVLETAQKAGVPMAVQQHRVGGSRNRGRGKTERSSGSVAIVRERSGLSLEEILPATGNVPERGLWLALDCLHDPQNVGAIFRSAGFFGVRGILVTKDKSSPMNSTVYDVSAGGVESVPFCIVTNLAQAIRKSKDQGLWVLGTSEHSPQDIHEVDRDRPWLLVIGNEQKGLRRLTSEHCDVVCQITPAGEVTSLNAAVAAGISISILNAQKVE